MRAHTHTHLLISMDKKNEQDSLQPKGGGGLGDHQQERPRQCDTRQTCDPLVTTETNKRKGGNDKYQRTSAPLQPPPSLQHCPLALCTACLTLCSNSPSLIRLLWALKSRQRPRLCSEDVSSASGHHSPDPLLGEVHLNSGSRRERETGLPSLQRNQVIFHIHVGSGSSPALFFYSGTAAPPFTPKTSLHFWVRLMSEQWGPTRTPLFHAWSKNVLLLYLPQYCDSMIPDSV